MANYRCTNCGQITEDHVAAVNGCMFCGAGYGAGRPVQKQVLYGVDLVRLAYAQRLAIGLAIIAVVVPIAIAMTLVPGPAVPRSAPIWTALLAVLYIGYAVAAVGLVFWHGRYMDSNPLATLIAAACAILPVIGAITMLAMSARISAFFRDTPVKFDWLGPDIESARRAQNPSLCPGCGYDLTGNVSGRCSECGRTVE